MAELITRREGAVGWIVFSNPARFNAMTFDMWRALPEALAAFDADTAVRLVVLSGEGEKAFVSGADISQFEQNRASEEARVAYNRAVEAAYLAPLLCAKPVVAQIRGICMGGGLGLAAACAVSCRCSGPRTPPTFSSPRASSTPRTRCGWGSWAG